MVDPVSSEGIEQAVDQTDLEGAGDGGETGASPGKSDVSFDEVLESGGGAEAPDGSAESAPADRVEGRDLEGVDDVDSATSPDAASGESLRDFVDGLSERGSDLDRMLDRTMQGEDLSQQELLEMQSLMYSYSQKVELASKSVEKATGGLKQMMQVQV